MSREIRAQNTIALTSVKAIKDASDRAQADAADAKQAAEDAATSADNAETSARNAASSAGSAQSSASTAETSASAAGRSAANAEAAAQAAEAAALSSITTDTLHYLATSASSGVTRETAGWTTTVQEITSTNRYLWTYHTYTAANGTTTDSDPVISGVYGQKGTDGNTVWTTTTAPTTPNYTFAISKLNGTGTPKIGDSIIYSYYRYVINSVTSTTVRSTTRVSIRGASGSSSRWYTGTGITGTSTTATIFSDSGVSSAVVGDMYLNTDTNNTYRCTTAGVPTVAKWVYENNIQGEQGIQGETGETGDTGNGIASIVKTGSSGLVDTYTITYTDGTTATFNLTNGEAGQQGAQGEQGVSVTAVQPQYYLSTSSTSATGGTWSNSLTYVAGKYIWTRDMVTYSTGTSAPSTAIYNSALTEACKDAAEALGLIQDQQEWFWHDSLGAHVLGDTSGFRNDINSTGMTIVDTSDNETVVASFGASGAQVGKSDGTNMLITATGQYLEDKRDTRLFEIVAEEYASLPTPSRTGFLGDGTTTEFADTSDIFVVITSVEIGGVAQVEGVDYTLVGANVIKFATPPANGVRINVYYVGISAYEDLYYTLGVRDASKTCGVGSVVEGVLCSASGIASHAEGTASRAEAEDAHAEGWGSIASGEGSHAEGRGLASGEGSHAEGGCELNSQGHHVWLYTRAEGISSHAEGSNTKALGDQSHAQNKGTTASYEAQTAIGKYNNNIEGNAFEIGNGTSVTDRSNAFTVDWDGNATAENYMFDLSDYQTADTTDKALYDAIVALGWSDVLIS